MANEIEVFYGNKNKAAEVAIAENSSLAIITKAEIDTQIATAHAFPRNPATAMREAAALACASPEIAASMEYTLPRGDKPISGPSVRFAEIVAYTWGNIRAAARIIEIGDREIVAQGICHDLEKNFAGTVEVRRRITDKHGRRYNDDMITVTGNAACSIAFRNAVFKVVPPALFEPALLAAKEKSRSTPLGTRVANLRKWLSSVKIDDDRVFAVLDIAEPSWALITEDHVDMLAGIFTSVKEGVVNIHEVFPPVKKISTSLVKKESNAKFSADMPVADVEEVTDDGEIIAQEEPTPPQSEAPQPEPAPQPEGFVMCPGPHKKQGKMVSVKGLCREVCPNFPTCKAVPA